MTRLKKPVGLIRYSSFAFSRGAASVSLPWYSRERIWICGILLLLCGGGLTLSIVDRSPLEVTLIRATDIPYQEIRAMDGTVEILNHFKVDIRNQTFEGREISFSIPQETLEKPIRLTVSNHPPLLAAGETERADLFVQFPKERLSLGKGHVSILIESKAVASGSSTPAIETHSSKEVQIVGPFK